MILEHCFGGASIMTEHKKLSKQKKGILIVGVSLVILLIALAVILPQFCFNPLGKQPDEIVVYKYGQTHTLAPDDEAYQTLYQYLHDAWEVKGNDFKLQNAEKGNLLGYADIFFDSGLVVQAKYNNTQTSWGVGSANSKYDNLVFLLDYPKEIPSDMSAAAREVVPELLKKNEYYDVYYSNQESIYCESFLFYSYPQEAKDYILQNFND